MDLLPAYVSYEFLEEMARQAQVNLLDTDKALDNKSKAELVQLILNGISASIDKSDEEIKVLQSDKKCNPLLEFLLRGNGKKRIEYRPKDFITIKHQSLKGLTQNPFTQFFLSNSFNHFTKKLEEENGCLIHHLNKPLTYQRLAKFSVELFKFKEVKNWSFVNQYKLPHHSIVIVDPHLFRDDENKHVVELIKNMINRDLKSTYYITLFVSKSSAGKQEDKASIIIPERVEWIESKLKEEFKNKAIKLEWVVYNGEEFHDRYIITNNTMIYSGYGFDLINSKGNAKKQTSWIMVNHAKIQDTVNGNVKTHFNTAIAYLSRLKEWISNKEDYSSKEIINPLFNNEILNQEIPIS